MAKRVGHKLRLLALEVAAGRPVNEAARTVGVSTATAYRAATNPDFKAMVAELHTAYVKDAVGVLASGTVKAVKVLVDLLDSKDERVRMRAAESIMQTYTHLDMYADMRVRLARLDGHNVSVHDQLAP